MNFYETERMHDEDETLSELLAELGEAIECREYLLDEGIIDANVEQRMIVIREIVARHGVNIELPFDYL